jgi:micrococcal nuclease
MSPGRDQRRGEEPVEQRASLRRKPPLTVGLVIFLIICYSLLRFTQNAQFDWDKVGREVNPPKTPGAKTNAPASAEHGAQTQKQGEGLTLERAIDGDSMVFRDAQGHKLELRLVGINAPEGDTPAGELSAEYALSLLKQASAISYETETVGSVSHSGKDKHGRTLAWVWLEMPDGQRLLLNEEMVRSGHAPLFEHIKPEMKYYTRLLAAKDEATYSQDGKLQVQH